MSHNPGPTMLDRLADEILAAVDAGLLHIALTAALTVPDICGAIDSPNNKRRYAKWFDTYVAPKFRRQDLSGADCWLCRCAVLHEGTTASGGRYSGYWFMSEKDGPHGRWRDFGTLPLDGGRTLLIDVPVFCRHIASGLNDWLAVVEDTPEFKEKMREAVRMLRLTLRGQDVEIRVHRAGEDMARDTRVPSEE